MSGARQIRHGKKGPPERPFRFFDSLSPYCGGAEGFMLLFEFFRCFFLVDFPVVEDDCVPLVALCAAEPFWSIELPAALEPELSFDVPVVVAD